MIMNTILNIIKWACLVVVVGGSLFMLVDEVRSMRKRS
jgi:hypothetical protein